MRRASKKSGVHRKKHKLLSDTRKTSSSLGKAGGIEGNTRKRWRSTRKKGRTDIQGNEIIVPECLDVFDGCFLRKLC